MHALSSCRYKKRPLCDGVYALGKPVFKTTHYTRVTKRNSFTIVYLDNNQTLCYGQVLYFLTQGPSAVVRQLLPSSNNCMSMFQYVATYIVPVVDSQQDCIIPVHSIVEKCVCLCKYRANVCSQVSFSPSS